MALFACDNARAARSEAASRLHAVCVLLCMQLDENYELTTRNWFTDGAASPDAAAGCSRVLLRLQPRV